jgi:hypothetical protein
MSCVRFTGWLMVSWEATRRNWEGVYREVAAREAGREEYFAVGTRFPSGGWGCGRLHGSDAGVNRAVLETRAQHHRSVYFRCPSIVNGVLF